MISPAFTQHEGSSTRLQGVMLLLILTLMMAGLCCGCMGMTEADVTDGVEFLHSKVIVHREIQLEEGPFLI